MSAQPPPLPKDRPILVWIIFIFYIYAILSTLLSFGVIFLAQSIPLTVVQKEYFASLTVADHLMTALVTGINLVGAIQFFRLKKQAPWLFLAAFLLGLAATGYQFATKNWAAVVGTAGLVGAAIGLAISIAIIIYAWTLRARRALT